MIVLDAGVLIGYLDGGHGHHDRAVALLTQEIEDDFAINLLTLAECRLTMPDCCVLLSAIDQRARLASFEDRLLKVAQERGVDVVAIT